MHKFLILSIGRTATMWLAETLGVDHEPVKFTGQAVSPRHLYLMTEGWKPDKDVQLYVMVRQPREQVLSIINRAKALGSGKLKIFRNKLDQYLNVLNEAVRDGAKVLVYEDLVGYSANRMQDFVYNELGLPDVHEVPRTNEHPRTVATLPPWAEAARQKIILYYNAWTDGHALEVDPDEPDPVRHEIRYGGKTYQMDYVFPAEIAALRAHRNGQFQEVPVLTWLEKKARVGVYIDCGAHVGNHSLFFANHCPSTYVFAIEAHPKIAALCEGNLNRNVLPDKDWALLNKAAWHKGGETVKMNPIPHNNAGHTCIRPEGVTPVQTMAIDDLKAENVVVLKIDVEDVEVQVINGALGTLKQKPILIAERHNRKQLEEFERIILPLGYVRTMEWSGIHTFAWECK